MTTNQDLLEAYKKAIRLKFEEEKTKEYSSFLVIPSRAKLRQLCMERLKVSSNADDLKSFSIFFGFEFGLNIQNRLQAQTDKFRPIETFLKGETDLSDIEGINIAALLVDFIPRPFRKFSKGNYEEQEPTIVAISNKNKIIETKPTSSFKKKIALVALSLFGFFTIGYTFNDVVFSKKQCMQWQEDHYEPVNCEVQGISSINKLEPLDKEKLFLKQIKVCDTTTCWIRDKAIVWYCKVGGEPQFFNTHGVHPETGKALKPMSKYIFDKYVKNKKLVVTNK